MTSTFVRSRLARAGVLALSSTLTLVGCRGEDPGDTDTATITNPSVTTTGEPDPTTSTTLPTTSDGTTTIEATSTTASETTTVITTNAFIPDTSTGPGQGPQPLGGQCTNDDECESMNCYTTPLMPDGGVCSECNEDQDCVDAGSGISCTFGGLGYATCTDGSLGNQCMSQEACQDGFFCEAVIDIPIPGIVPNTCSECSTSADCDMGKICSPQVDAMAFSGQKVCVEPGSVPNDSFCPHDQPDGDDACMSGHCTVATFMNIVMLGLCGECESDADCMGGACTPAMVGQTGISGSVCE